MRMQVDVETSAAVAAVAESGVSEATERRLLTARVRAVESELVAALASVDAAREAARDAERRAADAEQEAKKQVYMCI
jgi:hypothetical protein